MKPAIRTDRQAYPDVSNQVVDIVSQQPAPVQPAGVRVKRLGIDNYHALQMAGLTRLEALLHRSPSAPSDFGYIPRPEGWNSAPAIFHDPQAKEALQSAGVSLGLSAKLDEVLGQVAGQITDLKAATDDMSKLLPAGFKGLVFKGNDIDSYQDPVKYVQERSLHTLDELRDAFMAGQSGANRGSLVQDSLQKATALLQLRAKLERMGKLGQLIEQNFADLTFIDGGKLKTPVLC